MPRLCCVEGCEKSSYSKNKHPSGLYVIPRKPTEMREKWIQAIGSRMRNIPNYNDPQLYVCRSHFSSDDMVQNKSITILVDGKSITRPRIRECLKATSIPSIFNVQMPTVKSINKTNMLEVKQEPIIKYIKEEPEFVDAQTTIKVENQDRNSENPQISPTHHLTLKKEPEEDEVFFASTDIPEVNASDYLINTSDLVCIKQEISDLNVLDTDLPSIKSDLNFFDQPCSSIQTHELFEESKRKKGATKKSSKKKKYVCPICSKNWPTSKLRLTHLDVHFRKQYSACNICGKFFLTADEFLYHYFDHNVKIKRKQNALKSLNYTRVSSEEKRFKCKLCPKSFPRSYSLKCHLVVHTGEKLFKCEYCSRSFKQRYSLTCHKKLVHTGDTPFTCEICLKGFVSKSNLSRHVRIHSNMSFNCNICPKSFVSNYNLKYHMRIHTGDELIECEFCSKTFISKSTLTKHLRTHSEVKLFKCEICSKSFNWRHSYVQHKQMHTGEKLFKCEICSKAFSWLNSLIHHKKIHTGEKPFRCEICSKHFYCKSNLYNHLKIHSKSKPFECEICLKSFTWKQSLMRHAQVHTDEKPFKCELCLKTFKSKLNLLTHGKTHTSENRFKCEICYQEFRHSSKFKKHMTIHISDFNIEPN